MCSLLPNKQKSTPLLNLFHRNNITFCSNSYTEVWLPKRVNNKVVSYWLGLKRVLRLLGWVLLFAIWVIEELFRFVMCLWLWLWLCVYISLVLETFLLFLYSYGSQYQKTDLLTINCMACKTLIYYLKTCEKSNSQRLTKQINSTKQKLKKKMRENKWNITRN